MRETYLLPRKGMYKGLMKNLEIGNTPFWVLLVTEAKYSTGVFNKMLPNATKFQGYSFYFFWVIKGKPTGEWGGE